MSYITLGPNEIIYIKGIGYATLINCGDRNSLSQKVDTVPQKKESIVFDPYLFGGSDGDSQNSKKSQEEKEKPLIQVIAETNFEQEPGKKQEEKQQAKKEEPVNIVKARLEGSQVMVYTSDKNITKTIVVRVKCFLPNNREQIAVDIDISKTIDSLRKSIFQQLGLQMVNYYNIKLYTTSPTMSQLSVHSKTLINYQIKDNSKLILAADYAFNFRHLPLSIRSKTKITLNGNTLISTKSQQPKQADGKTPIPLPTPEEVKKKDEEKARKQQKQKQRQKEDSDKEDLGSFHAKCSVEFDAGKKYWQFKLEKVPTDPDDLLIGVCVESNIPDNFLCWECDYLWAYQPLSGKKIYYERDTESNSLSEDVEPYGYLAKQNDVVGVYLAFKGSKARLTFYKNSISCDEAYIIDLGELGEDRKLVPFVNIGGQCQILLDSKASEPLDSYRLK